MAEDLETPHLNLLKDPLIRTDYEDDGHERRSLAGVLHDLARDRKIQGFRALQPHQWHAWYVFMVQLAAMASLERGGEAPRTEEGWQEALRHLSGTPADDSPWCLVVPELHRPAFLQPPVPEGTLKDFKGPFDQPDSRDLDLLVTATDHDLKVERQTNAEADHWLFALVAYQTLSGYSGKYNYGVIRMNGGTATRPVVGLAPARGWSDMFQRDLAVLIDHQALLARQKGLMGPGHRLLWLLPWDGTTSVPWADCSPYCIEVARRVRLLASNSGLRAWLRATEKPRLSPKSDTLKGNVGDPWIPVKSEGQAANIGSDGWHYKLVRQILLGDGYHWAPAQTPRPDDPDPLWFYAAALARGQGKTEGFHERWVRIPRKAKRWLSDNDRRRSLAEVAAERVKRAGEARKTLHRALIVLLDSASTHPDFRDTSDRRWLARYDAEVDSLFFDRLWDDADLDRDEQRRLWDKTLRELAEDRVWGQVQDEVPVADARRERARVRAWMVLRRGLRKALPKAFEEDTAHAGS